MRVKTKIGWIQYEANFDTDSIQSRDHHDKSDFEKKYTSKEDGFSITCNSLRWPTFVILAMFEGRYTYTVLEY